jgi:DNA-directed RNA polymerase specialized sigma24 family protein
MTSWQVPGADDFHKGPLGPCPCGHGDVAAEIEWRRPLISRAIQGDPEAFTLLYDAHVDDVYRYLLAWTWDSAAARELTGQVFRGAVTWLPAVAEGKGDLGAWLIALARDAVGQQRGLGWVGQQVQAQVLPRDPFDAIDQLDDAQREVVVLRLLLGHSMGHTAHLAGYDGRVVQELELAACLAIWQLLSGMPVEQPPGGPQDMRAAWFEHFLSGAATDQATDSSLTDALSVADALRQGAPGHVPLPDDGFVTHLRNELLQSIAGDFEEAPPAPPAGRLGRAFALVRLHVARHPWAATTVAAGAIGLVLGVQLAGGSPTRSTCTDGSCVASTTAAQAAPQDEGTLPTLPAIGGGTTTTTTTTSRIAATQTSSHPSTTRGPSPTTAPPTTVPRTTRTTQAPTTTKRRGPPTTKPPTTTTTPPTTPPTTSGASGAGQAIEG